MSMRETRRRYEQGSLTKPEYIETMYRRYHAVLFDYAEYLSDTNIASIEISDQGVLATYRKSGVKLLCDPIDRRIAPLETLNFGSYEGADAELLLRLAGYARTVLDIGANIGWYAITMAKCIPHIAVHAFEPLPKTYEYLKRNISLNGTTNVRVYEFGLSEKAGTLDFFFYPEGSVNASARNLSGRASVKKIRCKVKRLDDVVTELGVKVDLLKCDVEGAELSIFQGATAVLETQTPMIFAEMLRKWSGAFGYHPNEIIELLRVFGYRCFTVREKRLVEFNRMDEGTVETNFFFLHPQKHARQMQDLLLAE